MTQLMAKAVVPAAWVEYRGRHSCMVDLRSQHISAGEVGLLSLESLERISRMSQRIQDRYRRVKGKAGQFNCMFVIAEVSEEDAKVEEKARRKLRISTHNNTPFREVKALIRKVEDLEELEDMAQYEKRPGVLKAIARREKELNEAAMFG